MKVVEALKKARNEGYALPAFNIFNYVSTQSVIEAANEVGRPIIIQTSVGTVKKFGIPQLYHMLKPLMEDSEQPVFLNLDHCKDVDYAKACVDMGWDMVMYDGSALPYEENIANTRIVTEYALSKGVDVEAELGVIAGVEEEISAEHGDTVTPEYCQEFVERSGVPILAPAVGTAHGVYKGVPHLNFELVKQLAARMETPLVIHGGTGLSEDNFKHFIRNGAAKINISTALKHAYLDGMADYLAAHPGEYNPIKMDNALGEALKQTALDHLNMFKV